MSDELRAAAERIRDLSGDVQDCLSGGMPHDTLTYRGSLLNELLEASLVLQKAYLAEHPVDDDEPVTREWLESMDLSDSLCMRNEKRYELINGIRIVFFACEYPQLWRSEIWTGDGRCHVKADPTRGDVRRLLAALGIEVRK